MKEKRSGSSLARNPLSIAIIHASILGITHAAHAGGIQVDTNSMNQNQVQHRGNQADVLNINAANQAGISHNKFNEFNVDSHGLIINNSTRNAGGLQANAHLNGNAASMIINEVIGSNESHLAGFTRIHGQQAEYILANPNGITCNGCSFENTNGVTLTTGIPELDAQNGQLLGIDVTQGKVTIDEKGVNVKGLDYFNIVSRQIKLKGKIDTNTSDNPEEKNTNTQVRLLTGNQHRFNVETGELSKNESLNIENQESVEYAIDASQLGSIYAKTIHVKATEAGVGVKSAAEWDIEDAIKIAAKGNIELAETAKLVTNDSGPFHLGGSVDQYNNPISLESSETIEIKGTVAAAGTSQIQLNAKQTQIQATAKVGAWNLHVKGDIKSEGAVNIASITHVEKATKVEIEKLSTNGLAIEVEDKGAVKLKNVEVHGVVDSRGFSTEAPEHIATDDRYCMVDQFTMSPSQFHSVSDGGPILGRGSYIKGSENIEISDSKISDQMEIKNATLSLSNVKDSSFKIKDSQIHFKGNNELNTLYLEDKIQIKSEGQTTIDELSKRSLEDFTIDGNITANNVNAGFDTYKITDGLEIKEKYEFNILGNNNNDFILDLDEKIDYELHLTSNGRNIVNQGDLESSKDIFIFTTANSENDNSYAFINNGKLTSDQKIRISMNQKLVPPAFILKDEGYPNYLFSEGSEVKGTHVLVSNNGIIKNDGTIESTDENGYLKLKAQKSIQLGENATTASKGQMQMIANQINNKGTLTSKGLAGFDVDEMQNNGTMDFDHSVAIKGNFISKESLDIEGILSVRDGTKLIIENASIGALRGRLEEKDEDKTLTELSLKDVRFTKKYEELGEFVVEKQRGSNGDSIEELCPSFFEMKSDLSWNHFLTEYDLTEWDEESSNLEISNSERGMGWYDTRVMAKDYEKEAFYSPTHFYADSMKIEDINSADGIKLYSKELSASNIKADKLIYLSGSESVNLNGVIESKYIHTNSENNTTLEKGISVNGSGYALYNSDKIEVKGENDLGYYTSFDANSFLGKAVGENIQITNPLAVNLNQFDASDTLYLSDSDIINIPKQEARITNNFTVFANAYCNGCYVEGREGMGRGTLVEITGKANIENNANIIANGNIKIHFHEFHNKGRLQSKKDIDLFHNHSPTADRHYGSERVFITTTFVNDSLIVAEGNIWTGPVNSTTFRPSGMYSRPQDFPASTFGESVSTNNGGIKAENVSIQTAGNYDLAGITNHGAITAKNNIDLLDVKNTSLIQARGNVETNKYDNTDGTVRSKGMITINDRNPVLGKTYSPNIIVKN